MIPLRLKLRDYCQHRDREIDFSAGKVIVITAPNGYGKSNIFYALKNALTGAMTPGANKLEDDIHDQAQCFVNELQFELNNGSKGSIIRTVQRKGANSVVLNIKGEREEVYVKSTEAIARFEQLLGVHPKDVCDVIIAEQRNIEALLFAPAAQRLKRFELFLHGDTFTAPIRSLEAERDQLFIDEMAGERKLSLEAALKDTRFALEGLRLLDKRHQTTLATKKATAAQQKQAAVSQHALFRATYVTSEQEHTLVQQQLSTLARDIAAIPPNLAELIPTKENQHNRLALAWGSYNAARQVQAAVAETTKALTAAQAAATTSQKQLQQLEAAAEAYSQVSTALAYLRCQQAIQAVTKRIAQLTADANAETTTIAALQQQLTDYSNQCAALTGPLSSLREAYVLLKKAQTHGDIAHCPVCQHDLKPDHVQSLAQAIAKLEADLVAPAANLRKTEATHADALRNLAGLKRELSLLATQQTQTEQQLRGLPKPIAPYATLTTEELVAQSKPVNATQLRTAQTELTQTEGMVARLQGQLATQQKQLPATITVPSEPEATIAQLKDALETLRQQDKALAAARASQAVQQQQLVALETKLAALALKATEVGLPTLQAPFLLSEEEVTYLNQLEVLRKEQVEFGKNIAAQEALEKQLSTQLLQIDACIKGAKDTKEYAQHLTNMIGYFKTLPHVIMKSQLTKLCQSMDEIIQQFHFFQPFRLTVNESLDFVLTYPNKLTRPIGKASGGERIILGIAFRLAAHRTLAPEIPWLAIDEPTNHLAEENIAVMADVIRHLSDNLAKYNLKKLIISTHSPIIAAQADLRITL